MILNNMNEFVKWMKEYGYTVKFVSEKSDLNIKTITNLRKIRDSSKVQLGTLTKLKIGFGDNINLKKVFPDTSISPSVDDITNEFRKIANKMQGNFILLQKEVHTLHQLCLYLQKEIKKISN